MNRIVTAEGQPVEVLFSPGKYHDIDPFKLMVIDVPSESRLYGDSSYTDYEYEDKLKECQFRVMIERKENSLTHHLFEDWKNLKFFRKKIETVFSFITALLPRND